MGKIQLKKNMKVLIFIMFLSMANVAFSSYNENCNKNNWCKGCDGGNCTACWSWGISQAYEAKYMVDNKCTKNRDSSKVTDCKMYKSDTTDDGGRDDCIWCKDNWLNIDRTSSPHKTICGEAQNATACPNYISNCEVNACKKTSWGTKATCLMCKKGFWPTDFDGDAKTYGNCTKNGTAPVANAEFYRTDDDTVKPYSCLSTDGEFFLNHNSTECKKTGKFEGSENCRRVHKDKNGCVECIHTYRFDGNKCELQGGLMVIFAYALLAFMLTNF